MLKTDDPFQSGAFAQHVQLCGLVQVTILFEKWGVVLTANEPAKALLTIEASVFDWCLADIFVELSDSPDATIHFRLIANKVCSCQSPRLAYSMTRPVTLALMMMIIRASTGSGYGLPSAGMRVKWHLMDSLGSLALPSHSCPGLFSSSLRPFGRLRRWSARQAGNDDAHGASEERAIGLQPLNPSGRGPRSIRGLNANNPCPM